MTLKAFRSSDSRIRTDRYGPANSFSISETVGNGSLLTEFDGKGEVLNQVFSPSRDNEALLRSYVDSFGAVEIVSASAYEPVRIDAVCTRCGRDEISRELDLSLPESISKVPVVPIFVCKSCKARYYALNSSYLRNLVASNLHLFEKDELEQRGKEEGAFIKALQDNVIRIFAAKKISKLKFVAKVSR